MGAAVSSTGCLGPRTQKAPWDLRCEELHQEFEAEEKRAQGLARMRDLDRRYRQAFDETKAEDARSATRGESVRNVSTPSLEKEPEQAQLPALLLTSKSVRSVNKSPDLGERVSLAQEQAREACA
mmetsp:Transcript_17056/g.43911  ORF Transcript_17056/g.43911 Transcript_17056/m.43911 type:complete len:125 (+) Transcript_17056:116-490(+)